MVAALRGWRLQFQAYPFFFPLSFFASSLIIDYLSLHTTASEVPYLLSECLCWWLLWAYAMLFSAPLSTGDALDEEQAKLVLEKKPTLKIEAKHRFLPWAIVIASVCRMVGDIDWALVG